MTIFKVVKFDSSTSSSDCVWQAEYLVGALSLQGHLNHLDKGIIYRDTLEGGCLEVRNVSILSAPSLYRLLANLAMFLSVDFVTKKNEWVGGWLIGSSVLEEALLPFSEGIEAFLACEIENECTAVSTSVEGVAQ